MERRPYAAAVERVRAAGLRPTRQRVALTRLLFAGTDRHVTAEDLHKEARANNVRVSLATIYNTLNQFTETGMLREVVVDALSSYFDTHCPRISTRMSATTIISSA
jgi:Fur family iron response transcriptional regulator